MSAKVYPFSKVQQMKDDGYTVAFYMTVISWALLAFGVVLCLFNLSEFNDRNLALMGGLGAMISSVFVYTIGTSIYLVQSNSNKNDN